MFFLSWSSIYKGHIQSFMKIIFISSIGLIFAVGVIASGLIYLDSLQQTVYTQALKDEQNNYYSNTHSGIIHYTPQIPDIYINIQFPSSVQKFSQFQKSINQTIYNRISLMNLNKKISSVQIEKYVSGPWLNINASSTYFQSGQTVYKSMYGNFSVNHIFEITPTIRNELQTLNTNVGTGIVPHTENNTEVYLFNLQPFASDTNFTPDLDKPTILSAYMNLPNSSILPSLSYINITGFTQVQNLDYNLYPNLCNMLMNLNGDYFGGLVLFVNNLTGLYNKMVSTINTSNTPIITAGSFQFSISTSITLNYHNFNAFDAQSDITILNQFMTSLQDDLNTLLLNSGIIISSTPFGQPTNVNIYFNQYGSPLYIVMDEVNTIIPILVLFLFPIAIVTLFVANFSFGIIHRQVLRYIGIYKTRGASNFLIFSLQILDLGTSLIFAIIGSLLVGIPVTLLIIHTDNFLSFNNYNNTVFVLRINAILPYLIISSIIFGLLVYQIRILRLSRISIHETENPVEKKDPFWKQHYLDVILFFGGGFVFFLFHESLNNPSVVLGPLVFLLFISPFILVIGAILLVSRLFSYILNHISTILWKHGSSLTAFALRNVSRHKQASTRAVMLIAVLLAITIAFLSTFYSGIAYTATSIDYQLGAEAVASFPNTSPNDFYNTTLMQALETNYSKYFAGVSPFLQVSMSSNVFLAINTSSFLSAAIFPINPALHHTLSKDMELLATKNSTPAIIIRQSELEYRKLGLNSKLTLTDANGGFIPFIVIDTFQYWPRLYTETNYAPGYNICYGPYPCTTNDYNQIVHGVINIAPFLINNFTFTNSSFYLQESGIYFKFKANVNQTQVAQWLQGNFSLQLDNAQQVINTYTHNFGFITAVSEINADMVLSIMIGFFILVIFAWMQLIERKKELYTERALGMKIFQLSGLFIIESLVLLLSGMIIGGIMGWGVSQLLIFIDSPSNFFTIIPYTIVYPVDIITEFYILLFVIALCGAIIPAYKISRQDISHSFAGEI